MTENPLKYLRIASHQFNWEIHSQNNPDKENLQKLLDAVNAEAHKYGLLVQIIVGKRCNDVSTPQAVS